MGFLFGVEQGLRLGLGLGLELGLRLTFAFITGAIIVAGAKCRTFCYVAPCYRHTYIYVQIHSEPIYLLTVKYTVGLIIDITLLSTF